MSYNGLPLNGPSVDEPPKKKKPDEIREPEANSSDEEVLNAVNQYSDSISLSIYNDKNIRKRNF